MSGGPDSLALLLLAAAAMPGRVEAATVDHGLRLESAGEARLVEAACRGLGVPHHTLPVAVRAGNLQDRARAARYAALDAWCDRRDLPALATAHQLDDQAETLVMRLNRGSGLAGLAGIRARGAAPGSHRPLLRPLLGWRRSELEEVVSRCGFVPACDPSNVDDRFDRARIRKALADADWLDVEGLARSAALLGEAEEYVAAKLEEAWAIRVRRSAEGFQLAPDGSRFETLELARSIVSALGAEPSRSEVATLVARLRSGANASLGGVLARSDGRQWHFGREPKRSG